MEMITNGGLRMPKLGLGTWRMKGDECREAVERALSLGYRHIDTAEMYGNEEAVGSALNGARLPRSDIHVTTKVWWENLKPDAMRRSMDASLKKLQTDYVDLYMIHWPAKDMDLPEALATLIKLKEEGLAHAIGVCNFPVALLRQAVEEIGAPLVANQVEYHVLLDQTPVRNFLQSHDMALTAYCPIAQGKLADHEELGVIAKKHNSTAAQIALKWLLDQPGVAAIPKAGRRESQVANLEAMKIVLDDADRAAIAALPKAQRMVNPGFAPAWDKAA
ncbi:aldo/keto reductase [Acidisphaera sp. L21]|uniref:aldo/keto reductase n=1 Tax=Acidisphaera sp. L21 TaxID=1641851 RepID=UPI00131A84AB|nr:aldo/keto reductase [Acidisphaera sp. L21]